MTQYIDSDSQPGNIFLVGILKRQVLPLISWMVSNLNGFILFSFDTYMSYKRRYLRKKFESNLR